MKQENIRRTLDAFYLAKRIRDMLPPLPDGVAESYIRFLDTIQMLEEKNEHVRISDVGKALNLQRPGVTRTIKEMESRGYLKKQASEEDGRVTYITITETGAELSDRFNTKVFETLSDHLTDISDDDVEVLIRTTKKIYDIICSGRIQLG